MSLSRMSSCTSISIRKIFLQVLHAQTTCCKNSRIAFAMIIWNVFYLFVLLKFGCLYVNNSTSSKRYSFSVLHDLTIDLTRIYLHRHWISQRVNNVMLPLKYKNGTRVDRSIKVNIINNQSQTPK